MKTSLLERYLAVDPMRHFCEITTAVRREDPEAAAILEAIVKRLLPETIDLEAKRKAREGNGAP